MALLLGAVTLLSTLPLWAAPLGPQIVDRAVVRFTAPETGGARSPRFVFERALAFEARLEALADRDHTARESVPYRERHVRGALERNIAETLLASLRISPEPSARDLNRQTAAARRMLVERVGGPERLAQAALAEGIEEREILRILRRQARASLYLDRMVAPMLRPGEAELRSIHRTVETPFSGLPFNQARAALERWVVSRRLVAALANYYQNARSRLQVVLL